MRIMRTDRVTLGILVSTLVLSAGIAQADVINERFAFRATVSDQFVYDEIEDDKINTGINESFQEFGGLEISPFSRSGWGGGRDDFLIPNETYAVAGNASFSDAGEFSARLSTDTNAGTVFDFPSSPSASAILSFNITRPMPFELFVNDYYFDNDVGAGQITLRQINGGTLFEAQFDTTSGLVLAGTLGVGEYRLIASSFGTASSDVSISIVPAPGALALLGFAGFAGRRRR
ncbi:MAG: hypothetical protein AAGG07_14330 [Planctomycetota bacterium]